METADQSITFEIPAAIQGDFIDKFVTNADVNSELKNIVGKEAWNEFTATVPQGEKKWTPVINNVALGKATQYEEVDTLLLLSHSIKELSTAIKKAGVSSYKEAYTFANDGFKYG